MTMYLRVFFAIIGFALFIPGCASSPRDDSPNDRRLSIHSADVTEHDGWMETDHFIGGSRIWISPDISGQTIQCDAIVDAKAARDVNGRHVAGRIDVSLRDSPA